MKKLFIVLTLPLLLNAKEKIIITKTQLICLNKKIDRYISEEADPVFVILENHCEKEKTKKTDLFSITKVLPDLDFIPISSSPDAVSIDNVKKFTKEELKCLKKFIPKYLNENKNMIEITLQCP